MFMCNVYHNSSHLRVFPSILAILCLRELKGIRVGIWVKAFKTQITTEIQPVRQTQGCGQSIKKKTITLIVQSH